VHSLLEAAKQGTPYIPLNRPQAVGNEARYVAEAIAHGHLAGNGLFADQCTAWLEQRVGCQRALLTPSCTAALEMATLLADIEPGDEVIMPSFTFVSGANAVVLAGGVPVFVDIRPDTLNLDPTKIEPAVTPRTKAIMIVHYAGVACDMEAITEMATRHGLVVIEDAAHALTSSVGGRPLGSIGALATLSFHATKPLHSGEGGSLLINDARYVERAEILQEKGTNRARFMRGEVPAYAWLDRGSSYLLTELAAAFLWGQLEQADAVTADRLATWNAYHDAFAALEQQGSVRRPVVPTECMHNANLYYLLLPDRRRRDALIASLAAEGIQAAFHYVPLHSSPAGTRYGRACGDLTNTDDASDRLVRLPLWNDMPRTAVETVVKAAYAACGRDLPAAEAFQRWSRRSAKAL
jgi:dTDP-4-amino-4,6-dideoxygalactose transaminase